MKPILNKIAIIAGLSLLASCQSFFDEDPVYSTTTDTFFNSETALETYAIGFLESHLPSAATLTRGDQYSDICVTTQTEGFLKTGGYSAQQANNWARGNWRPLYNVNYYLKHMKDAAPLCGRRDDEALRGRRPLLARVVLLGQGQDLRRRALVRRADRPRRRRTALQGPRPARLRHAEGPRRPRLRRHLVLQGQQIRQHQRHQPLCGAGPEIAHLPLRGNLAEVPRAGRQRGMAPRVRRRLGGADGRQPLFAGLDGRRGDDQLQQGLQERGAAVHRSDPGQRVQRHAQPVSRRLVVLRLGQLRTTQLGSQSVRQHVPEPRRDALHGQGRIQQKRSSRTSSPAATTACARPSSRPTTSRRSAARRPTNSQRSSPA